MKIIALKSENIKRIAAVSITPDPSEPLVVLGGTNGSGKSSCLDSILYAIAGNRSVPELPVRRGEERGVIEIDLGELKIRRVFTAAGGSTLVVTNKEGAKYSSPQSILDALVGKLSFDPLEFSRQKPAEQYETLRALAGLDFSSIDSARQKAYDERTQLGREIKQLEGQLSGCQHFPDAPEQEISTAAVMDEWRTAAAKNEQNQSVRHGLIKLQHDQQVASAALKTATETVSRIEREIEALNLKLSEARSVVQLKEQLVVTADQALAAKTNEIQELQDIDVRPFQDKIQGAETINRQVRLNQQRAKLAEQLSIKRSASDAATRRIEDLDVEKRRMISKAKLPIDGLQFEAGKVLFNGIPFSQMSSAEQLRISVAVGLALNPKLKVLLVRDGSLLDDNSMRLLAEMAEREQAQVWCEVVKTDGECSVVIEDGRVKGQVIESPVDIPADKPVDAPAAQPDTQPVVAQTTLKPRARRAQPVVTNETPDIFA